LLRGDDPDNVKLMSECAGDKVDEVFIGSYMTNTSATLSAGIGNYRAAAKILDGAGTVKGGAVSEVELSFMDLSSHPHG
jgi:aconitate hydratase 2/2-methylisocitrate dehydratase